MAVASMIAWGTTMMWPNVTLAATVPQRMSSLLVRTNVDKTYTPGSVKNTSYPLQAQSGMAFHSNSKLSSLASTSGAGSVARLNVLTTEKSYRGTYSLMEWSGVMLAWEDSRRD
ncbi:MAG: hypothetical protein M1294_04365 [Firmicutes bacterium]|nr:hypothetical protein [Bacillota bacterium]